VLLVLLRLRWVTHSSPISLFFLAPWVAPCVAILRCLGTRPRASHFQVGKLRPYSYVPFPSLFGCCFEFMWRVWCYFGFERLKLLYESVAWAGARDCCRKTMTRPANLAQAGQSRLSEMNRDSPKPSLHERSPRRPTLHFEQASISLRRERSRLGESGLA